MWADSLFSAERQHLILLLTWSIASLVVGSALGIMLLARGVKSSLLRHFAAQFVLWGVVEASIAGVSWRTLRLRDAAAAAQLEHALWMNVGLEFGYIAVGATLAFTGWFASRRLGPVGAGAAVAAQGIALLLLDVRFLSAIAG